MNTSLLISGLFGLLLGFGYSKVFIKRLEMYFLQDKKTKRPSPWWEAALLFFISYVVLTGSFVALIVFFTINIPVFALTFLLAFIGQVYIYARSRS
jgi:hypothetical protein